MPVSHILANVGCPSVPDQLSNRTAITMLVGMENGVKREVGENPPSVAFSPT